MDASKGIQLVVCHMTLHMWRFELLYISICGLTVDWWVLLGYLKYCEILQFDHWLRLCFGLLWYDNAVFIMWTILLFSFLLPLIGSFSLPLSRVSLLLSVLCGGRILLGLLEVLELLWLLGTKLLFGPMVVIFFRYLTCHFALILQYLNAVSFVRNAWFYNIKIACIFIFIVLLILVVLVLRQRSSWILTGFLWELEILEFLQPVNGLMMFWLLVAELALILWVICFVPMKPTLIF